MMQRCIKLFTVTIVLSCLIVQVAAAQSSAPAPCTGDPDDLGFDPNSCPLDTWVFLLAAIVFIFAVTHLHKKGTGKRFG